MNTFYQMTISGKEEFQEPRYNLRAFLDTIQQQSPKLLTPNMHGELMKEFARFVGLKPEQWGMSLDAIKWLLTKSPDIERACRQYRSDAF